MMVSTPKVKQEPQKIITLDYKPDIEEPIIEEPIIEEPIIEEPIKEEPVLLIENIETKSYLEESLFGDIKENSNKISESKDIKTENEVKGNTIIEDSIAEIIEEPLIPEIPETVEESINIAKPIETESIIEEPIKEIIPNTKQTSQPKEEEILFSWDDDDFASVEENAEEHIREALNKEEPETEKKEETPLNRHAAKRRDMSIRRRSVSIEEDVKFWAKSTVAAYIYPAKSKKPLFKIR
jgi:hypothetical protein